MEAVVLARLRWLVVFILSLLVSVLLCELFLRAFLPMSEYAPALQARDSWRRLLHRPSQTPGLVYEMTPQIEITHLGVRVITNAYGMRGPDPRHGLESPAFRVAILGDSVSFGWGVEQQDAWPSRLQTLMDQNDSCCEVLNFSVSGYNVHELVATYKHKALVWKPQVTIIGYILNDPEIEPSQSLHRAYLPFEWWQHFHLSRLGMRARASWRIRRHGDYFRYLHTDRVHWSGVVRAFQDIRDTALAINSQVLVLIFPLFDESETWENYKYSDLHDQVAALARANGFETIDLVSVFTDEPPAKLQLRPNDPLHPSAAGHALAAEAATQHLTRLRFRLSGDID